MRITFYLQRDLIKLSMIWGKKDHENRKSDVDNLFILDLQKGLVKVAKDFLRGNKDSIKRKVWILSEETRLF